MHSNGGDQHNRHWAMIIDLRKCIGCNACTAACKIENNIPEGRFRTWVGDFGIGTLPATRRYFLPRLCNQCDDAPCVEVCPVSATYKRNDGIVVIDGSVCIGCGYCVEACPYDSRFLNELTNTADKCTFCAHRIDAGLFPACVESCVAHARIFGDINDPGSEVSRIVNAYSTVVLKQHLNTRPRVYYIELDRRFVEG